MDNKKDSSKSMLVDINEIQEKYLPISKKGIRNIANKYLRTVRIGNKILVDREQLEAFLRDPDRERIK
jgi:hypothetical protein